MVNPAGMAEMEKGISYRDMMGMAGRERIAFTVDVEEGRLQDIPYWRGRVLESFDGTSWSTAPGYAGVPRFMQAPPSRTVTYRFTPYKLQSNTVYVAGVPLRVTPGTHIPSAVHFPQLRGVRRFAFPRGELLYGNGREDSCSKQLEATPCQFAHHRCDPADREIGPGMDVWISHSR